MDEKDQINTHCLTFMREIVPKWPLNIILSGPEQIGKTYASVWLAKHLFEQRIIFEPYFVRASELRKEKNEEGYWGFNYPREADYLVVDDLGSETVITQFSTENQDKRALIFEAIDFRTGNELCTIITTNLSPEYLRTRYSIKTISRLENNGVIKEFPKL
ncbi:MAG: hypothetical protein ACREN0_11950, partial [Thermodesulfobacteriota bacterium]